MWFIYPINDEIKIPVPQKELEKSIEIVISLLVDILIDRKA
jgi:hypothetical protein